MGADVWVVCKNPGGTNGVLPVVTELYRRGRGVVLITNGKANELLRDMPHLVCDSAANALRDLPSPKVILTSMCWNGGVGRDLVGLKKSHVTTFALQDWWGGQLTNPQSWGETRPDFICVNDKVDFHIVRRAWSEFHPECIIITGYPALDQFAHYDVAAAKAKVRLLLGLKNDWPIVLLGGELKGTSHLLSEMVQALCSVSQKYCFIPRAHPRMKDDALFECLEWNRILEIAAKNIGYNRVIFDSSTCDTTSLVAAADVVLSGSSSILVEAAVLRKQVIAVLYPETGMKIFLENTDGIMPEFPLVSLGCAAKAENRGQLTKLIRQALTGGLGLESKQEQAFNLDGKNASRVADLVVKYC